MKNKTSALSAQLDTQQANINAVLETSQKLKSIRQDMVQLLDFIFPPFEGHDDHVDDAMDFVQMGVVDELLQALEWRAGWDNSDPAARSEFFAERDCPFDIAYNRSQEETPVLDQLIAEAPDEVGEPVTDEEFQVWLSEMREMLKEDGDE